MKEIKNLLEQPIQENVVYTFLFFAVPTALNCHKTGSTCSLHDDRTRGNLILVRYRTTEQLWSRCCQVVGGGLRWLIFQDGMLLPKLQFQIPELSIENDSQTRTMLIVHVIPSRTPLREEVLCFSAYHLLSCVFQEEMTTSQMPFVDVHRHLGHSPL